MASIKLYKDSTTGLYVLGNRKSVPSGTCIVEANESDSYINIISTTGIQMESGNVSDFIREDGSSYALLSDILSELSDFFVKAPAGGGGDIQLSTSLNETATGKASDATLIKYLNDNKYPRIQNGTGFVPSAQTLETLVGVGFNLNYANISNANLNSVNLEGARLSNANLNNTYFDGVNLGNAYLDGANLASVYATSANFNQANLKRAYLSYAYLSNATFFGANLDGAYMDSATLDGTFFISANLNGADLSYAYLNDSIFDGANLEDVNLSGARLLSANLSYATGLDPDINVALESVDKDPNGDGLSWTVTWTDGLSYSCNPLTGLFTIQ